MRSLPTLLKLLFLSLPLLSVAEAAVAANFKVGDRVLVAGRLHRKCSARVESLPSQGYARLGFDQPLCGDSAQPYSLDRLQNLSFVDSKDGLRVGDSVVLKGHFSGSCAAKVKEITRSGYVALEHDALLCADTEALYKARDLTKVSFISEATLESKKFTLGQRVTAPGINQIDCQGRIQRLTDNGLAALDFDQLTCAYSGKLFPLSELKPLKAEKQKRVAKAEEIFQRVMREIASSKQNKKSRKQARL